MRNDKEREKFTRVKKQQGVAERSPTMSKTEETEDGRAFK